MREAGRSGGGGSRGWSVREADKRDKFAIMDLFAEVFGQTMTEALWDWKYDRAGGCAVVGERNGRIIAHYGGIPRNVAHRGREEASIQCVDTMVQPGERGTLSRKGPYFLVATAFLDRFVGEGRPFRFGFGFPNKRVMRIGEILGVQAPVGEIVEPVWAPLRQTSFRGRVYVCGNPAHRRMVDRLWSEMRDDLDDFIVGVRGHEHLEYRYFENPVHEYDVFFVTPPRRDDPIGLVVTRDEGSHTLLLDLIGPCARFPELLDHVRYLTGIRESPELHAWITLNHLEMLGADYGRLDRPEVMIPTSICTEGPDPEELRDKWWLTAGDAEFK